MPEHRGPPSNGASSPIEVRLLSGVLRVRRSDGTTVTGSEWRTRKTADLLTLLAVAGGDPVPVARLVDALWPGVDEEKGRASLRTAASTLRKVLATDCLTRDLHGMALRGAWVDAAVFASLAEDARRAAVASAPAEVVRLATEAASLYESDFTSADADSEWAAVERERLRHLLSEVLARGAEAAVNMRAFLEAAAFATRLLELNPFDERGYRGLMLAHAGLGELERAVQTYHRCRTVLADELGLDPAPQTRAAYQAVLRAGQADADHDTPAPLLGEVDEVGPCLSRAAAHFAQRRLRQGNAEVRTARRDWLSTPARAATNVVVAEHQVLLGEAPRVVELLASAIPVLEARTGCPLASGLEPSALLLLARHDLGMAQPSAHWLSSAAAAGTLPAWLAMRMLVETGAVAEAGAVAVAGGHPAVQRPGMLAEVLDGMSRAAVLMAQHDGENCRALLQQTLEGASAEAGLLVPELAARLAMVQAGYDPEDAAASLDLAEAALGHSVAPRERWAMLLARAAIRFAAGRLDAAVVGAEGAAVVARETGLVHLQREAETWRARYSAGSTFPRPRTAPVVQPADAPAGG